MPKLSLLPSALFANGADFLPGDQGGVTKTFTVSKLRFSPFVIAADGPTITFDLSSRSRQSVTLTGNRTLAFAGDSDGQAFAICIIQDSSGGRTVTWPSGIRWAGGAVPALSANAHALDLFTFLRMSLGNYLGIAALNFA